MKSMLFFFKESVPLLKITLPIFVLLMHHLIKFLFGLFLILFLINCRSEGPDFIWQRSFLNLGSSSSPSCVDLNKDGILDCVIGAGLNEFDQTDSSVLAINGMNGEVLWAIGGRDQVVGSPVFLNINEDDVPDVVIGGRGAQLFAVDGFNGNMIWEFQIKNHDFDALGYMRFNFYTPQVLHDINEDGVEELLVSNGGNFSADPVSGDDRYPGVLAIISGLNGEILAAASMPDEAETYMSPVIIPSKEESQTKVVYGSGGETFGGHLYEVDLTAIMNSDLSTSRVLLSREENGFIAPPTITDITSDGKPDIIVNWHGGEMIAIDRSNYEVLWTVEIEGTELYASPTPGHINDDGIPDFFTQYNSGEWPVYTQSHQVIVDGATGQKLYHETNGCESFSTALSADMNDDGLSEFMYTINDYKCESIYLGNTKYNLQVLNYSGKEIQDIVSPVQGKNIFVTPWLGDLDGNAKDDLIICIHSNYNDKLSYHGMHLFRFEYDRILDNVKSWNQYLGPDSNGNY